MVFMKKFNVGWGLTNLCNMNCKFCYSKETREKSRDISIEDWKKFVDDNYQQIDSINYGTGENAILDDFFYFIEYVRENYPQITQSLTTNGYVSKRILENSEFMRIFMKSIDEIDISLDFVNKEKHNDFRGQSKAYDWAMQTLELLKNTDKKITIVFIGFEDTMQKENIDDLFLVAKKYNTLLRLNIYRPVSTKEEINERFKLSYKTLNDTLKYINEKYKVIGLRDVLIGNLYVNDANIKENTGIGSIRILPNGNISPSTYLISEQYTNKYNIKDEKVLSKIHFEIFENVEIPKECQKCAIKDKCKGGVYDRRILWYGTLSERDPYCPTRYNEEIPKDKFDIEKQGRISVHDDYLPTLFFGNL